MSEIGGTGIGDDFGKSCSKEKGSQVLDGQVVGSEGQNF